MNPHSLSTMPRSGAGTMLTLNEIGAAYGAAPGQTSKTPQTNWRPSLTGRELRLSYGAVSGIEPLIGGRKMTSTVLRLEAGKANAEGESWVCVEVQPAAGKNELLGLGAEGSAAQRVELVQVDDPNVSTPEYGRFPVTLIKYARGKIVLVDPIAHFSPRYQRVPEAGSSARHLFL